MGEVLFLQRRLVKQSAANRRRNMRKLLRGNELAYYFEKLGISKSSSNSGKGGDMHMLGDEEAARNLSKDEEHALALSEVDHVMMDDIDLEEFGLYDV